MKKEKMTKERKKAKKILEDIEKEQAESIIKAAIQDKPLPKYSLQNTKKMYNDRSIKKKRSDIYITEVFVKEYLTDWLAVILATICFIASFFIPRFEIAWIFSIAILGTIAIRHPIAKIITTIFVFCYFLGVVTSGYYLNSGQIWSSMIGLNTIFKWSFLFGSLATFIAFSLAILLGVKKLGKELRQKILAAITLGLMSMSIIVSFLDVEYQVANLFLNQYIYFPNTGMIQILLINSAGFFFVLILSFGGWYIIAWIIRTIIISKRFVEAK